ncbi:T7SS effector LXG polymorphic toxin [Bacillus sp. UNC322MFChir4.1]|uniref:T7SS effector LXG polymorphic toxin n=1 Tax=Bacillus sp. UNC322MFChir4.1 TaxID=1449045 RepID=UPI0005528451|nr:T7SS effector LXG polymorphic toxin [Bacillus sp. UNC322MFChir4.1]
MDKNIELQEVKELQSRFQASATELEQHFESLMKKIDDFKEINSFQGETANSIKDYLSTVHESVISIYVKATNLLKEQFQKTIDDFNNTVDSDADVKIYGIYLDDVKKKINGYSEGFNQSNNEATQTVGSISDIIAIQYPSSSGITEGAVRSQKEISDTLEKLETYNSQQNDLQAFREMMSGLDDGMNRIRTNSGDFSSDSIGKIMSEDGAFLGSVIVAAKANVGYFNKGNKWGKGLISSYLRFHYMKKNLGFGVKFDIVDGDGQFLLKTLKPKQMVEALEFLKADKDEDHIFKFFKGKVEGYLTDWMRVTNPKITNKEIESAIKEINELPEFEAYKDFKLDWKNNGLAKAVGTKSWSSLKTELGKGVNDLKPWKWKDTLKELGGVGKVMKSAGIAGSVLSVANNVVEASRDGWQLHDAWDIATDSAVDVGTTAGAAAAGAVAGSFFLPPIGTAVGAGVGIVASLAVNTEFGILGGESVVSSTKKGIKSVTKKLGSLFGVEY